MTNEQMHRYHEEVRNEANILREKAEQYEREGYETDAEVLRAEARGMILALSTFWNIANEVQP